ncbi:MAG: hypothetical protein NC191_00360, partial [Muribaculaceae bacterium]|nr:hypothetical protein [Muribaculaceae bacterium]
MDFSIENNKEREFFKRDFSQMDKLIKRIRLSLMSGEKLITENLYLAGILDFDKTKTFIYITLLQEGQKLLRWGALKDNLTTTINRNIEQIRKNPRFQNFDIRNPQKCRIMIEYITEETPVTIEEIDTGTFVPNRFEPGVSGIKLYFENSLYVYMPTESYIQSQLSLNQALNAILRKTSLKNKTDKISERIELLKRSEYECSIIKSRAFVTYNDEILPLYRGTVLNDEYSTEKIREIALNGIEWIYRYQQDNGK